jgi:hypothetical protein
MFFVNIWTEPRSSKPSLLQTAVHILTTAVNTTNLLLSLASPFHAVVVLRRMQRNVAWAWPMALMVRL